MNSYQAVLSTLTIIVLTSANSGCSTATKHSTASAYKPMVNMYRPVEKRFDVDEFLKELPPLAKDAMRVLRFLLR